MTPKVSLYAKSEKSAIKRKIRRKTNMSLLAYGRKLEESYESLLVGWNRLKEEITKPEYRACTTCRNCRPGACTPIDSILDIGFISRQADEAWISCSSKKLNILVKIFCPEWTIEGAGRN
jgi:hypothetical protein